MHHLEAMYNGHMGTSEGARKGWSEERKRKQAETMRLRAQDPEYRARVSKGVRKFQAERTPEERSESARKTHTPESDEQRAETMRQKWEDEEYRAQRAVTEAQPEVKARRSAAANESNSRPGRNEQQAGTMREKFASDEEFRERHSAGMQQIMQDPVKRAKRIADTLKVVQAAPPTRHEEIVSEALSALDIEHELHYIDLGMEMDIYVPSRKLDIEVDGATHYVAKQKERDIRRGIELSVMGHRILRLSHRDIENGKFISKLREALGLS